MENKDKKPDFRLLAGYLANVSRDLEGCTGELARFICELEEQGIPPTSSYGLDAEFARRALRMIRLSISAYVREFNHLRKIS